jgi:hypothetical protein
MEKITAAGNTEVPAYRTLKELGFSVRRDKYPTGDELWVFEKDGLALSGPSPLEVLGLYAMRAHNGLDWKPREGEVEAYFEEYYPEANRE